MAAPTTYNRQTSFANYQALNPSSPLVGSTLDSELNNIKVTLDEIITSLGLIQADDGTLQNGTVGLDQLDASVSFGSNPPTAWATNTNYVESDTVFYEAVLYLCLESHLSGTFATDLADEKWEEVADFVAAVNSAVNIEFTPTGTIAATNVQTAVAEVATEAAAATAAATAAASAALAQVAGVDMLVKTASSYVSAERVVGDSSTIKANWATAGAVDFYLANPVSAKTADFTIASTDKNKLFLVDTTSAEVTATLPTLSSGDAGWQCETMKTNSGTNAMFIAPASGTLQSGAYASLAKARRCIPGRRTRILWTGTAWLLERVVTEPIGAVLTLDVASLPVGFEWANGQTLSSASTKYPEFYAANGSSGVVTDHRGRVSAGKDDMGGSSANRLTDQSGGLDGDTLGDTGGAETHTLTTTQMPAHTHTGTTASDGAHTHTYDKGTITAQNPGWDDTPSTLVKVNVASTNTGSGGAHTHTFTTASSGSDGAHNNVQPTIISNKIVVVE